MNEKNNYYVSMKLKNKNKEMMWEWILDFMGHMLGKIADFAGSWKHN